MAHDEKYVAVFLAAYAVRKMTVFNKKTGAPPGAVYVGRPSKFGNPFEIGRDGTRQEVIEKYLLWLLKKPELLAAVRSELKGKDLVCWCAPAACHADILQRLANSC